jgi:hypothetical protein
MLTVQRKRLKRLLFVLAPLLAVATIFASSATDSFNRADSGTLGANWTELPGYTGGFQISGNKATPVTAVGAPQAAYYTTAATTGDQYSEGVLVDAPYITGLVLRASGTAPTQHAYLIATGSFVGSISLSVLTNTGASSGLTTFSASPATAGQTLRGEAEDSGGNVLIRVYLDGVQQGSTYTDSTYLYSGGQPGIYGNFTGYDSFESWAGGDLTAASTSPLNFTLFGVGN